MTTYLTDNSDKKIKEVDNGIRFTSYQRSSCPAEYVTYYDGKNEELKIEELKAFRNHTEKQLGIRIDNAIIKNLNFTKISNATFFEGCLLKDVTFQNGDLSGFIFRGVKTVPSSIKFEDITLPPKHKMPEIYNGSIEIYNKLKKYIFGGEAKIINGQNNQNYVDSLNKKPSLLYYIVLYRIISLYTIFSLLP